MVLKHVVLACTMIFSEGLLLQASSSLERDPEHALWSNVDLWDGSDEVDVSSIKRPVTNEKRKRQGDQTFLLLGPMNSGTNLMQALIENNFDVTREHVWKHSVSSVHDIYQQFQTGRTIARKPDDTTVVMVIRSPLSWMASMKDRAYEFGQCFQPFNDLRTGRPCNVQYPSWSEGTKISSAILHFQSRMDMWNRYVQQYQQIVQDDKFKKAVIIPYEDIVRNTTRILDILADALELPIPSVLEDVQGNAAAAAVGPQNGWHDNNHAKEQAIKKLESRSYLQSIPEALSADLCSDLDFHLSDAIVEAGSGTGSSKTKHTDEEIWVSGLGFGLEQDKTYSYDCREYAII